MSSEHSPKEFAWPRGIQLNQKSDKGRYLTATKELKLGAGIISEEAFAAVAVHKDGDRNRFCQSCFKDITSSPAECYGCHKALFCCLKCKILSWKRHHWIECFMEELLNKRVSTAVKLALRTLLQASYSFHDGQILSSDSPLEKIAEDLCGAKRRSGNINSSAYLGDYWDIYCLQRHENELATEREFITVYPEIQLVTDVLMNCFGDKQNEKLESERNLKLASEGKKGNSMRLSSLFKKLLFASHCSCEHFDIREWKVHVEKCCKSAMKQDSIKFKTVSLQEMFSSPPLSEKKLLERLLVHHALQVRTNGQAIFRICRTKGHSHVQDTTQIRIATGFFPTTSLMNHSCSPNTSISFDGTSITVVASKRIKKGEEICHCYGPHFSRASTAERQKVLQEQYFFDCKCVSCIADTTGTNEVRFNLQFNALKCEYCDEPVKPERDIPSHARCTSKECGKMQDVSPQLEIVIKLMVMFEDACSMIDGGLVTQALKKLKNCLNVSESILHRNHLDIGKIHDKIAQCCVMLGDFAQAVPHLRKSISIIGMMHGTQSVEMAHELQKMASLYFNLGDLLEAAKIASKVLSVYKTHYHKEESFPPGSEEMRKIIQICG